MVKISSLGYHLLGKIPDDTPLRKVVPTRMEVLPWVVERDEEGDLLKRRLPSFEELEELTKDSTLTDEDCLKLGNVMASFAIEKYGTVNHKPTKREIENRMMKLSR